MPATKEVNDFTTLIGASNNLIRVMVHHFDTPKTDPANNAIKQAVLALVGATSLQGEGLDARLEEVGLGRLCPKDEQPDTLFLVTEYKTMLQKNRDLDRRHTEDGRSWGWKAMAATNDRIRGLIGNLSDNDLWKLMNSPLGPEPPVLQSLQRGWTVKAAAGLCRWAYGYQLGYLNEWPVARDNENPRFTTRVASQDPHENGGHRSSHGSQSKLMAYWFSTPFSTAQLRQGRGLLPFDPCGPHKWTVAMEQGERDGALVDKLLEEAAGVHDMSVTEARRAISVVPYVWARFYLDKTTTGTRLMCDILRRLRELHRGFGPTWMTWRAVHSFVELQCGPHHGRWITLEEEDEMKSLIDGNKVPDPEVLIDKFPHHPVSRVFVHCLWLLAGKGDFGSARYKDTREAWYGTLAENRATRMGGGDGTATKIFKPGSPQSSAGEGPDARDPLASPSSPSTPIPRLGVLSGGRGKKRTYTDDEEEDYIHIDSEDEW